MFKDSGWLDDDNAFPSAIDMTGFAGQHGPGLLRAGQHHRHFYETWAFVDDVSLVYKKFVDLAVDGNGNDVFGNDRHRARRVVRRRSTLPGDTLVFDLDVENEGLDADSYTLSGSRRPPAGRCSLDTGACWVGIPVHDEHHRARRSCANRKVLVVPPVGAPRRESSNVIVDAVSRSYSNRYDSVRLGVNVLQALYGTDLVVDGNGFGVMGDERRRRVRASRSAPWDSTVSVRSRALEHRRRVVGRTG